MKYNKVFFKFFQVTKIPFNRYCTPLCFNYLTFRTKFNGMEIVHANLEDLVLAIEALRIMVVGEFTYCRYYSY